MACVNSVGGEALLLRLGGGVWTHCPMPNTPRSGRASLALPGVLSACLGLPADAG